MAYMIKTIKNLVIERHLKASLVILILLSTSCAATNPWKFETHARENASSNGAWIIKSAGNKFSSWIESKAVATNNANHPPFFTPFIEVENNNAIIWPDLYICATYGRVDVNFLWQVDGLEHKEKVSMNVGTSGKFIWFLHETNPYSSMPQWNNRFLYMLNYYDFLAIQFRDTCGEYTYLEFDISGQHHIKTTQIDTQTDKSNSI